MDKYIKKVQGDFHILPRDELSKSDLRSVNSQNSLIFNKLMTGAKINLWDVIMAPIFSSKLATRMSDIRKSLQPFGIEIKHDNFKNHRNADYFVYYLDPEDIIKLENL